MDFASNWALPAHLVMKGIAASNLTISGLITFIVLRRWYRRRYFERLERHTSAIRRNWEGIVSGTIPPESWRLKSLDSEIVESILLDNLESVPAEELPKLLECARRTGLLDVRIYQARHNKGWNRRAALVALGRIRAPETVPALAEALDDPDPETRVAAIRGLGRTALPEAAIPIIEGLLSGGLTGLPDFPIKNALANCCRVKPQLLLTYLKSASGTARELLARVLGELATADMGDELMVLATDPLPEVRAAAARALANGSPAVAFPMLAVLANDPEWFVRLRAVVAVGSLQDSRKIRVLLRAICDLNRHVRQRAACILATMEPYLTEILDKIIANDDRYALQAFISELDRSGAFESVVKAIHTKSRGSAVNGLLDALKQGQAALRPRSTESQKYENLVR